MESLHEKVEVEPTTKKREFFKNILRSPVSNNYDERNYFLDSLGDMSLLECEIMAFIKTQQQQRQVGEISKPGINQYAIVGTVGRLNSRGFLTVAQGSFTIDGDTDNSLQELMSISAYGDRFYSFCLSA